ncbi:TPA: glucosyltransferase domain-containing protein [Streptococcus suis]
MFQEFKIFLKENNKFIALFVFHSIVTISIGLAYHPYIDDADRQVRGLTNFGLHYARYLTEYMSWFVQGDKHLVELGLTTHFLTAIITTMSAIVVLYLFNGRHKVSFFQIVAATFLAINPWFIEVLSFRFDAPYIAMSVLVSVLPFLYYNENRFLFYLFSTIGIFLMCNAYQASSGIYLVVLLSLSLISFFKQITIIAIMQKLLIGLSGYGSGMLFYMIEMKFNTQLAERDITTFPSLSELPVTAVKNVIYLYRELLSQMSPIWIFLIALIVILFPITLLFRTKRLKWVNILLGYLYIFLGFISSTGVFIFMSESPVTGRPRYIYGFAFFVGIILILFLSPSRVKAFQFFKTFIVSLLVFYMYSFSLSYATMLYYQNDSFNAQSIELGTKLSEVMSIEEQNSSQRVIINTNRLFKDSEIYRNTLDNYPILDDLIFSNSTVYWPNSNRFRTQTELNVDFKAINFNDLNMSEMTEVYSNVKFSIFRDQNQVIYLKWN